MIIYSNIPVKNNLSFGESQINICAFSDLHGNIRRLPDMYNCIQKNAGDMFKKNNDSDEKDNESTLNAMVIGGDYFFNPALKGYISDPTKTSGYYQCVLLQSLINSVKNIIPGLKTFFVIGNHDLDAGDKFLFNILRNPALDMLTVITNVDFNSKEIAESRKAGEDRFIDQQILTVKDDKNDNLKNSVLLLGLTPQGLDYYFPKDGDESGITDNFEVFDRHDHLENTATKEELTKTNEILAKKIIDFRQSHMNEPVIICAHTGEETARIIATELAAKGAPVNFILSGHDHKEKNKIIELQVYNESTKKYETFETQIIPLSQNGELLKLLKLHFSDKAELDKTDIKTYQPEYKRYESEDNPLYKSLNDKLKEDIKNKLKIIPDIPLKFYNVSEGNSPLANIITDIILKKVKEKDKNVAAFGISSSAFRRSLHNGSSNMDIINVLSGSIESQSVIQTGELSGEDLGKFILEDIYNKKVSKEKRFPVIKWAGIRINRTKLVKEMQSEKFRFDPEQLKHITIMNTEGVYEPLNPEKTYKIALPNKFFVRSNIESIKEHKDKFKNLDSENTTLNDLWLEYLKQNNYTINVSTDERDY